MIRRAGSWILLTCLVSWPLCALPALLGHHAEGPWLLAVAAPYILAPFLSTALWRRLVGKGDGSDDLGAELQFNPGLWAAWLLPVLLLWGAALTAHFAGWATIDLTGAAIADRTAAVRSVEDAEAIRSQLAEASMPYPVMASLQGLVVGVLFSPVWYGAELGWRGVLLRELRPLGFWNAALLSGLLWGIWRVPLLLVGGFLPGDTLPVVALLVAGSVPLGALLAWLRVRSGTVWAPAVTLSVLTSVGRFDELVLAGGDPMRTSPLGIAAGLVTLAIALALFARSPLGPEPYPAPAA